jgi:hypothetical protein
MENDISGDSVTKTLAPIIRNRTRIENLQPFSSLM